MTDLLLNERELRFQLYELLDTEALLQRPRYAEHDRGVFDASLTTARQIAAELFAPHNQKGDANEPTFDGERGHMIAETKIPWERFAPAGFPAPGWTTSPPPKTAKKPPAGSSPGAPPSP